MCRKLQKKIVGINAMTYNRLSNAFDRPGRKLNKILVIIPTNEVKGNWVKQRCYNTTCTKWIGYWSKTGERLEKYSKACCEIHK